MKRNLYCLCAIVLALAMAGNAQSNPPLPVPQVLVESEVFTLLPPDNGSGPLWSYGCSQVARAGDDVYVSVMETGSDVPLLCNTKWRLLKRDGNGWQSIAEDESYRQREPCPIAVLSPGEVVLNVNDSIEPPGTKYGKCLPQLRVFGIAENPLSTRVILPKWAGEPYFTDHSYRGFSVDPQHRRILMLNIDAHTSVQNACLLAADGETLATSSITFPIRACYPQVALRDFAVHVLAIGDIVEPVEAWRQYKFEQTKREWDYVFRRLFYTRTEDIRNAPFETPIEIDSVDDTAGYISNQDLWVAPDGEAWILYTRCEVQSALMRDKFFPDKSITPALCLARVNKAGEIRKEILIEKNPDKSVTQAKFQLSSSGMLYVVLYITGADGGMKLQRLLPEDPARTMVSIPLEHPLSSFCLANVRSGNAPSDSIDIFGTSGNNIYRYAGINIHPANP